MKRILVADDSCIEFKNLSDILEEHYRISKSKELSDKVFIIKPKDSDIDELPILDKEEDKKIKVSMLGEFKIIIGDTIISANSTKGKKIWSLLEYLIAYRNKTITQQELIQSIWEEEVEKPEYALKTLCYRLRETLKKMNIPYAKELIEQKGGMYRWNNSYSCIVDCEEFEKSVKYARDKSIDIKDKIYLYENVLQMYTGDFLANSAEYQWVVPIRMYYHNIFLYVVHELLKLLYEIKDYEKIKLICISLLQKEEFDEEIHCYYLKALINLEEVKSAVEHYKKIKKLFIKQLGIEPSDKVKSVIKDVLEGANLKTNKDFSIRFLKEHKNMKGAFYCDYDVFKSIYQVEVRALTDSNSEGCISILTLNRKKSLNKNKMSKLTNFIKNGLYKNYCICKFNEFKYLILLRDTNKEDSKKIMDKLLKEISENKWAKNMAIEYKLSDIK